MTSPRPNSDVQRAWLITATRLPIGVESSRSTKDRPRAGGASKNSNSDALTPATFRTRDASPEPTAKRHSDTAAKRAIVFVALLRSTNRRYGNVVLVFVRPRMVVWI